jgi:hypothetical protein
VLVDVLVVVVTSAITTLEKAPAAANPAAKSARVSSRLTTPPV